MFLTNPGYGIYITRRDAVQLNEESGKNVFNVNVGAQVVDDPTLLIPRGNSETHNP